MLSFYAASLNLSLKLTGEKTMDNFKKNSRQPGWVEVITGGMYSGKTEELIRQIRRSEIARQKHLLFKPRIDDRYSETEVTSHNLTKQPSIIIDSATEIFQYLSHDISLIGVDEAQFFDAALVSVANKLANSGIRVIIAGLDLDSNGAPFGPMPQLMAIAEIVKKQHAICTTCGASASRSQRLISDSRSVLVGAKGTYEARCRTHFDPQWKNRQVLSKNSTKNVIIKPNNNTN